MSGAWTTAEIQTLQALKKAGAKNREIAERLDRSVASIENALSKLVRKDAGLHAERLRKQAEVRAAAQERRQRQEAEREERAARLRVIQKETQKIELRRGGPPILGSEESHRAACANGSAMLLKALVRHARKHHPASDLARLFA